MKEQSVFEQQRRNKRFTSRKSGTAMFKGETDRAVRMARAARKSKIASARERELIEG